MFQNNDEKIFPERVDGARSQSTEIHSKSKSLEIYGLWNYFKQLDLAFKQLKRLILK